MAVQLCTMTGPLTSCLNGAPFSATMAKAQVLGLGHDVSVEVLLVEAASSSDTVKYIAFGRYRT